MDYFNNPSGIAQGAIDSSLTGGSVVESIIAGFIFDKLGSCKALAFACIWWLLGTSLQVATNGHAMLISSRALNRITVRITSSQIPVYLAEIANHDQTDVIITIQQLVIE